MALWARRRDDKSPHAESLAGHLTRTLIIWVGGAWLIGVLAVVWYVDHEINQNFDNELAEISHRLFDFAARELDVPGQRDSTAPLIASEPLFSEDTVMFIVMDASGKQLLRTADAPTRSFGVPLVPGYANAGVWRIYTVQHPSRPLFLQVADPLEERRTALNRTLLGLIIPLAAVLPLLALVLRNIARKELRPLQWLAAEIRQRGGADLRPIELPALPQELRSVGDDANHLLERLAQSLDVERALAANAAHELRTPLAAARLRLQTALDHDLRREDIAQALEALRTLSHRAEKLLQLSRAESGASLRRESVDLVQLAGVVAQEFWADDEAQKRLDLRVPQTELAHVLGDVDALAIALRNLVENALRHGPGVPVVIEVMAPCTLAVRDFGPGVSAEQLETLAQRHVRHSPMRTGYGLGVSIVNTIVSKHGGRLELFSPPPGANSGLEARIVLRPMA
ncbi:HAMP domain-containing sensor histidine kinase [Variovorax sp. J22R133]|uniref:sensor histidine kinase n=1 Tax=Variovorax brevis TaxID=3053503 RepID=UPI0025757028|nr:HAMP domain-containing sensor histidine kinase [Variovorax sp. J22R133]MDM0112801.1 HAMP domain-containing sensor histidine kinase [Variovorax sp. J22R133]